MLGAVAAVAVLGIVVATVSSGPEGGTEPAPAASTADRADVVEAASTFAAALFTYDHADLDAARDRLTELATTEFADAYTDAFDGGLADTIREVEATSSATVREVLVGEVTATAASAVVVVDASVTSVVGTRDLTGAYVRLDLDRVEGAWLVERVQPLTAEDESLLPTGPPDG